MKLKHADIVIPENEPFKNCKLNRKKYAEVLTSIVGSYADGFVLAINNEWGTGKTTFVKMWQQHLKNKEFKTLYFNAWENDYDSDPLVALLAELKKLTGDTENKIFKSVVKKAFKISKNILPLIIKGVIEKHVETKGIIEAIDKITDGAIEIFEEEVNEYAERKQGLLDFKKKLEEYINEENNDKPVVFIIDELDRCRPNYAVEVLEKVKHFFSIPGIVFILSIDKIQLGNAIRGFYGSEHLNANEYLRRFIDIEYRIPKPKANEACKYFYEYFEFNRFFYSGTRNNISQFRDDGDKFIELASIISENESLSLRQIEKLFSHARLVLNLFQGNYQLFPTVFFYLIYIRDSDTDLFGKIKDVLITPQILLDKVEEKFLIYVTDKNLRTFIYLEAILLLLYNNNYQEVHYKNNLLELDKETGKNTLTVESKLGKDYEKQILLQFVESVSREFFNHVGLSYLLNKIELMEDLIT